MAITWLASYPKSGNTWFRIFLTNLQRNSDQPANINAIDPTPIASARHFIEDNWGIDAADLSHDEIDELRPPLYTHIASTEPEPYFSKIHDGFYTTPSGQTMFPASASRAAVYLIRNPLDVACSYAHHSAAKIDKIIKSMEKTNHNMCGWDKGLTNQLRQTMGSWSEHVLSWTTHTEFPVHLMRYEDMVNKPLETFSAAASFLNLPDEPERIDKALKFSAMDELQRQEAEHGFREKMQKAESFFRQGKVGCWQDELNQEQIDRIVGAHREVMERYGYLENGRPIV